MSFRAITEFILHIEHFRNIDLLQQGLYFLKFQIYHKDPDCQFFAHPYHHDSRDNLKPEDVGYHKLVSPQIYESEACFCTKTFFVRYAEEVVILRDIVKMRTETDTNFGNYMDMPFYIKAELYWLAPP